MRARLAFLITLAVALTACVTTPSGSASAVALRTWVPASPVGCPMARNEGVLVRQSQSGAGLLEDAGAVLQVIWPTDYVAREEDGRLVVLDGRGSVVAREGDRVEIGGGYVGAGIWLGCGGMRVMAP